MVADAEAALAQGRAGDAEAILRRVVEAEPHHDRACVVLAGLLADDDRTEEALALLSKVGTPDADRLVAALRLRGNADVNADALRRQADGGNVEAAVSLAQLRHAEGDDQAAFETLISALQHAGASKGAAAREALLDLFKVLGNDHDLVRHYRREMARVLF